LVENSASERAKVLQLIVESDHEKSAVDLKDQDGETALHLAARRYEPQAMRILLRAGYGPSVRNNEGSTPMHLLISACRPDDSFAIKCLGFLLQHGADPSTLDGHGKSPLSIMIEKSWTTYVDRLRAARDPLTGETYVFSSSDILVSNSVCEKIKAVKAEEARNTPPRLQEQRERLRQRLACQSMESVLSANMARLNSQELAHYLSTSRPTPYSALSYTAMKGGRDTLLSLLAGKGNINARDEKGYTALDYAKQLGRYDIVKVLLDNGAI
jgi:ankyrin repeat protein